MSVSISRYLSHFGRPAAIRRHVFLPPDQAIRLFAASLGGLLVLFTAVALLSVLP